MTNRRLLISLTFLLCLSVFISERASTAPVQNSNDTGVFNVRSYGAKGDGKALDSPSINIAIDAAAAAGGGTVRFPAGTYRSFSIRLRSNVSLYLDQGATIVAADPKDGDGKYDDPEPNQWDQYQD